MTASLGDLIMSNDRQCFLTMSLNHDFILLDRTVDGEWELTRFIHDARAIHVHDDLIRYIFDTLKWIPTHNPGTNRPCYGLNMWGPTLIEQNGAAAGERVFRAWARLFEIGPSTLELTGGYTWLDGEPEGSGQYERLQYSRDETVSLFDTIANYCLEVQKANGRLYVYHDGV